MKNPLLMQSLKARGLSVTKLARLINSSHAQVSLTLNNTPGRGYLTQPKLAPHLSQEQLKMLGWDINGRFTPGPTPPCHVEQVAT